MDNIVQDAMSADWQMIQSPRSDDVPDLVKDQPPTAPDATEKVQADDERVTQDTPAKTVQAGSMDVECARWLYDAAVRERKAIVAAGGTVAELRKAYGFEIELRDALATTKQ
jgi:hypothetical protein